MISVLMTGSSGLIGSAVIANLRTQQVPQTEQLLVVPWQQAELGTFLMHANRKLALDKYKPDVVMHFAWHPTSSDAYEFDAEHGEWMKESLGFAEECINRGIWFICAGSAADSLANRAATHIWDSDYAKSKRLLREGVLSYLGPQNRVTWLQIEYVYSLVKQRPRLVQSLLNAKDPAKFQPQFPERKHDFIDVDDVAQALRVVLVNRLIDVVIVGSGYLVSTLSFVQAIKLSLIQSTECPSISFEAATNLPHNLIQAGWTPKHTQALLGF
jgi:nucleoside-diphosphate-sugar epimerase